MIIYRLLACGIKHALPGEYDGLLLQQGLHDVTPHKAKTITPETKWKSMLHVSYAV